MFVCVTCTLQNNFFHRIIILYILFGGKHKPVLLHVFNRTDNEHHPEIHNSTWDEAVYISLSSNTFGDGMKTKKKKIILPTFPDS